MSIVRVVGLKIYRAERENREKEGRRVNRQLELVFPFWLFLASLSLPSQLPSALP